MPTHKKQKKTIYILWATLIIGIIILLILLSLYYSITYVPSAYHPVRLDKKQQKQAEALMWKKDEAFRNHMGDLSSSAPFAISYEENLLNALLLHDEAEYYLKKVFGNFTRIFRYPQIKIQPDFLKIMGQLDYRNINTIITIVIHPEITETGKLKLKILSVKTGLLKLPDGIINEIMRKLAQNLTRQKEMSRATSNSPENKEINQVIKVIDTLIEKHEIALEPVFKVFDKRYARIKTMYLEQGKITVEFEPKPGP